MAFVYIIICSDNTLYTGSAVDIEKRLLLHNLGRGAKYTRGRTPVKLLYSEELDSIAMAYKREAQIKKMSRKDKFKLAGFYEDENS